MRLTTLTLLAGVLLGLTGGAAMATGNGNDNGCKKNGNAYDCTVNNTNYTVSNATSEAAALAAAVAQQSQNQAQAQQQGQVATGGDASATGGSATASNGNQSVNIDNRAPKLTTSIGLGVNVNIPIASGVEFNKTIAAAEWLSANGYKSEAYIAIMSSSVGKRIQRNTPEGGEPICQMTKDGVLQVNKYTNVAECKAYHGVK